MTLADVAGLAGVRRPVTTIWRSRPQIDGEARPFPDAIAHESGHELFDADAVVTWLETTGRGNNPDVRADAAAHVQFPVLATEDLDALDAVEALLCLRARTDATLADLNDDDLLDLADQEDPDDAFLFRETELLGPDLLRVAAFVDALSDAAYGPVGALGRVDERRPKAGAAAKVALSLAVMELVGELGAALALDFGHDSVTFADPTGFAGDLASACLAAVGERVNADVSVGTDSASARSARRRHVIRGSRVAGTTSAATVVLARFPHRGALSMTPAAVLGGIDNLQLDLPETQRTIIVGPAAVLCDALPDRELDAQRDHLLRLGRLRCVIRLPKGLAPGSGRQALGLWVLGPDRPQVVAEERWVTTGDLSDTRLTGDVVSDLATDVVTSVSMTRLGRSRTFRHVRASLTSVLLAGRGPLVAAGVGSGAPAEGEPAQRVLRLRDLVTRAGLDDRISIDPRGGESRMPRLTFGEAVASGAAQVLPGARLDMRALDEGRVRVLTVDVLAGAEALGVDPIAVERAHPRARRTEPGDVVFATSPRPRAAVDRDGFSLVAFPARVLRCDPAQGLLPDVVAAAINAQPSAAREWRGWAVPRVPAALGREIGDVARVVAEERGALLRRLSAVNELAAALTDGIAVGSVTVSRNIAQSHEKCDDMQYRERTP